VRVQAAGINGADLMQRAGHYPPPAGTPADQPGLECSGVVEVVGDRVRSLRPGDRVMALMAGGAQAELATVHESHAMPVPDAMSPVEAGAFPEAFCTAHDALFTQGGLAMGDRVLVTGAAGGVGVAAVQLAVAAGATVVASARSSDRHAALAGLGATPATPDEVRARGPYDVVLELVGAPSLATAIEALAPWGRVVVIGTGAGSRLDLDLGLLMRSRATLRASTLRNRSLEDKAAVVRRVEHHVLPLVARGAVRVLVEDAFAFSQAQAAYERFAAGAKLGKLVLTAV
jgi:NADPH:quinone reductase-like Zn-dependent oxidoreductase